MLGMGIGSYILSQQGEKPAAGGDCGVKVGTLVFLFDLFL